MQFHFFDSTSQFERSKIYFFCFILAILTGCESQFVTSMSEENLQLKGAGKDLPVIRELRSDATTLISGDSTRLHFQVVGAENLRLDPGNVDVLNQNSLLVSPRTTTRYRLTATNSNGTVSKSVEVTVSERPPESPSITEFSAVSTSLVSGQSTVLNFSALRATSLKLMPGDITVTGLTSKTVSPASTTTYTLTATNSTGSVSRNVVIEVRAGPVVSSTCDKPLTLSERGKVKFYPGHYVALGSSYNIQERLKVALAEIRKPNLSSIVGVQKRYYWSDLQGPTKDDFDFTQLNRDIKEVQAAGKKLSIMIMWKFQADRGQNPVPQFLKDVASNYQYPLNAGGKHAKGFIAYLGNPAVAKELARFLRRLAEEVDGQSAVASIVFAESALGIDPKKMTPPMSSEQHRVFQDAYIDGLLWVNKQASCAFKHTPVIQLTNFPTRRVGSLMDEYVKWSISMGGPDVWIKDKSVEPVYDLYPKVQGKVPIGMIVAGGNFNYDSHGGELVPEASQEAFKLAGFNYNWSPAEVVINLAHKARTRLKPTYLFWKKNGNTGDKFYHAFLGEISKLGTPSATILPTVKDCPSNYAGACVSELP